MRSCIFRVLVLMAWSATHPLPWLKMLSEWPLPLRNMAPSSLPMVPIPVVYWNIPGVVKDPARIRESWNAVYQGSGNAHRVAVLEEGMKFQSIGIPPEQAQFLETRKFQINEIARIFRVPPHMVGDLEKSSFSNIEQQSLEFVKYTLDPWVIRWEQAIQRALFSPLRKRSTSSNSMWTGYFAATIKAG